MQTIHYLKHEMARPMPQLPLEAVQGDSCTRAVQMQLLDNGEPWTVPEGITAAVAFRKPDRTKGLYDTLPDGSKAVTIDGSTVTAILAPQVLRCAGKVSAAVVLTDGALNQLATFPFTVKVAANPAAGQSVSNDYYNYSTMEAVSEAVEDALASLEQSKQDFLAEAEEVLRVVHDTATEDAPGVICEAAGPVIQTADSAERPLQGLKLYGKTTQDGTPTPEAPAELVSVGGGGSVVVTVNTPGNLLPAAVEKEVTVAGITFTAYSDGSYRMRGTSTGSNASTRFPLPVPLRLPDTGILIFEPRGNTDRTDTVMAFHTTLENGAYQQLAFRTLNKNEDVNALRGKVITATSLFLASAGATIDITLKPSIRYSDRVDLTGTDFAESRHQTLTVSTPNGLPGIPVSGGGNYTDADGQSWLCDEVDLARGVYVQRVARSEVSIFSTTILEATSAICGVFSNADKVYANNAGSICEGLVFTTNRIDPPEHCYYENRGNFVVVGTPEDTLETLCEKYNGLAYYYVLAAPVETALPAQELAAFAALQSYKPNTVAYNTAGAHMALSYVADTKCYIDQKISAISAAILG